jgi:ZIP family zinc transporter
VDDDAQVAAGQDATMNDLVEAIGLGLVSQASLLIAGVVVCWITFPTRLVGILAGFGAGALISAVAFDLIAETIRLDTWELALGMLGGAAIFLVGDRAVERRYGDEGTGGAMGIVVGSVVDGVPESAILGISVAAGAPISAAFVFAVFVSNIPQAIAPSADLASAGWGPARLAKLWGAVLGACVVAAALGYVVAEGVGTDGSWMAAIAAGGLLAMLTDSLIPFAYERGRDWAGVATVVGFCLALGGS